MGKVVKIHASKQPRRPHYIAAWAESRGKAQKDIVLELGADKSVVSRWFNGTTPGEDWQERLAAYFQCDKESLFRHPDDDWLTRFLRGRKRDEIDRIKQTLESAFPRKAS